MADQNRARGIDDSSFRYWIRSSAGLSKQEEAALNAITADWAWKHSVIESELTGLSASGVKHTDPNYAALRRQDDQNLVTAVGQIREAFGRNRFAKVDKFIAGYAKERTKAAPTSRNTKVPAMPPPPGK